MVGVAGLMKTSFPQGCRTLHDRLDTRVFVFILCVLLVVGGLLDANVQSLEMLVHWVCLWAHAQFYSSSSSSSSSAASRDSSYKPGM